MMWVYNNVRAPLALCEIARFAALVTNRIRSGYEPKIVNFC